MPVLGNIFSFFTIWGFYAVPIAGTGDGDVQQAMKLPQPLSYHRRNPLSKFSVIFICGMWCSLSRQMRYAIWGMEQTK
jgi:hypothetical protein